VAGQRLEEQAATRLPPTALVISVAAVPGHDLLAVSNDYGGVRYLDSRSRTDASPPAGFPAMGVRALWNPADLRACAGFQPCRRDRLPASGRMGAGDLAAANDATQAPAPDAGDVPAVASGTTSQPRKSRRPRDRTTV
jgi:hypothetical protein